MQSQNENFGGVRNPAEALQPCPKGSYNTGYTALFHFAKIAFGNFFCPQNVRRNGGHEAVDIYKRKCYTKNRR
jgi:hypothetical protein